MKPNEPRPHWFVLYLLLPLLILLFWLQSRLAVPSNDHELLELGILLLVYFLVARWIKVNEAALIRLQLRENSSQAQVDEVTTRIEASRAESDALAAKSGVPLHSH